MTEHAQTAVVLACRNEGPAIDEAVRDASRVDPSVEVLVIDDWCTDVATMESLTQLENTGHRVVRAATPGRAAAWNGGIDTARHARYIALVVASDRMDPGFISAAGETLDTKPDVSFVLSDETSTPRDGRVPAGSCQLDVLGLLTTLDLHRPAVFRREVWTHVDGFDPELGELAEVDFWVTALERGHGGVIVASTVDAIDTLDTNAVHATSTAGAAPTWSISRERWKELRRRLYEKHLTSVTVHTESLLVAQEALILGLRRRQEDLVGRTHHLRGQLAELEAELATTVKELQCR